MPMNAVDQLLSDTADAFEAGLNAETCIELEALLNQGNTPGVIREINKLPGVDVVIQVKRR
jgi:hypothetical protein